MALVFGLLCAALVSCGGREPTPGQVLSDGVVTEEEYLMVGGQVLECLAESGHQAEMQVGADGAPSFITEDEVDAEWALENCRERHVGDVERVWADQNPPSPEEEIRSYNSAVSCVEREVGKELGDYTGPDDSELLDHLRANHRAVNIQCLEAATAHR